MNSKLRILLAIVVGVLILKSAADASDRGSGITPDKAQRTSFSEPGSRP